MKTSNNSKINNQAPSHLGASTFNLSNILLTLTSDLVCPKCGFKASNGNFFVFECASTLMILSATKNNSTESWVVKEHKYAELTIKNIKCLKCLKSGDISEFSKVEVQKENFILVKIYKIKDDVSVLKANEKTFFIDTDLIPRKFSEGDNCEVHGILFSEIKNGTKIDSEGVFVK